MIKNLILFVLVILGVLFSSYKVYPQGFNWKIDSRMPHSIPDLYFGINATYGLLNQYGPFNLREDFIECCNFDEGNGHSTEFGLSAEYWYDGLTAFNFTVGYKNQKSDFVIQSELPTRNGSFITNYEFVSTINYLSLNFGAKHRIYNSHFSVGGGIGINYLINSSGKYTEQAISDNVPFEKRILYGGNINELNSLIVNPYLFVGYDVQLTYGYYVSPYINLAYTVNSLVDEESWRVLSLRFGLRLFRFFNI
ncbi:hypothetical protein MASR1M45_22330 [Candidatus Kapaibacterium sp.]